MGCGTERERRPAGRRSWIPGASKARSYFLLYVISIIFISLPSLPGPYISKISVVGLGQRVVIRVFIGAFLIGSVKRPVKVQFFPCASQVPSLTISPVDMLSFQVDQYFPVTLS